jgi:hypothetical protein
MATPLGIPLGIDFARLDSDLNKVADRIESVGKSMSIRLGGGDAGTASTDAVSSALDQLSPRLGQLGLRISQSIATGVRSASASMLDFTGRITPMLDRMAGSVITMFQRIDSSMKFPTFQSFFQTAQLKISNFAAFWRKPLSDMDIAISGGFGGTIAKMAKLFKMLFDSLGKQFSDSMMAAMNMVVAEMKTMFAGMRQTESSANLLAKDLGIAAAEAARFAKFPPMGTTGMRSSMPGPKIGHAEEFVGPPAPVQDKKSLGQRIKQFLPDTPQQMGGFKLAPIEGGGIKEFVQGLKIGTRAVAGLSIAVGGISLLGAVGGVGVLTKGIMVAAKAGSVLGTVMGAVGVTPGAIATTATLGSALGVVGLKVGTAAMRSFHFLSSLGDVAKKTYSDMYGGEKAAAAGMAPLQASLAKTDTQVKTIGDSAKSMGSRFVSAGSALLAAFGVVGVLYKVVTFFKDSVKGASELNETVAVGKGIFGDSFSVVATQADAISKKYGIMRSEQLKIAEGFGAMASGAGMTEKASAALANVFTETTLNFAQTWQIPFSEASEKVKAGLAGQARGLKQYGVWLDDAAVKNYAVAHGARLFGGELTKQDALMARAAIVTQGLSYTTGALDRASGGAAAQFRKAGGGIGEFGVRIGELVMPAVQKAIEAFNTFLATVIGVVEYASPAINGFARFLSAEWTIIFSVVGKVGGILKNSVGNVISAMIPSISSWGATFSSALSTVELMAANMPIVWEIIKLKFGEFVENSIRRLGAFRENFGRITGWLKDNWLLLIGDMGSALGTATTNIVGNISGFGTALWKAVNSKWFLDNWTNMVMDMGAIIAKAFENILGNAVKFGKAVLSAIKGQGFKHEAFAGVLDGFQATTAKMPEVLKNNFKWTPLLEGFQATAEKLPEMISPDLINVSDQVKELWGKMKPPGANAAGRGKRPGEIEDAKKPDYKLASAVEVGSKEASSILAKSQALARGGDTGMKTVSLLGQSVSVQKELLAEQKKSKPAGVAIK